MPRRALCPKKNYLKNKLFCESERGSEAREGVCFALKGANACR